MRDFGEKDFTTGELINVHQIHQHPDNKNILLPQINIIGDNTHSVQFYEDSDYIISAINKFINGGDAAIVVGAAIHEKKIDQALRISGLDIKTANERGIFMYLDAATLLSQFMIHNFPKRELFFEIMGNIIKKQSKTNRKLRIFGEMVALLWAEGNQEGAIQLEKLWNELQQTYSFSLFCAYPIHGFSKTSHALPFERIEQTHSQVIPSESYSELHDQDKQLREIAILQQKAQALESEIIEHKKTEALLVEAVASLRATGELNKKIKDDFMSATSHELKTPLTSQKTFIHLLQKELKRNKDEKYEKYLIKIDEQTNKLKNLVEAIVNVSNIEEGKLAIYPTFFDIHELCKQAAAETQASHPGYKVHIRGKLSQHIFADKEKIYQVIANILSNAVKYSHNSKNILILLQEEERFVKIFIKDFGIGIDKKNQEKIFERFFRGHQTYETTYPGLGLGLYIASEIIKQHKGTITVESKPMKGTTFKIILPML